MARERPRPWGCAHHYPIVVDGALGGGRAKCLGCGSSGHTRADAGQTMLALRAQARYGQRLEA